MEEKEFRRGEPGMKDAHENAKNGSTQCKCNLKMQTKKLQWTGISSMSKVKMQQKNSKSNASVPLQTPENAEERKCSLAMLCCNESFVDARSLEMLENAQSAMREIELKL
jgi:hypothetical protein